MGKTKLFGLVLVSCLLAVGIFLLNPQTALAATFIVDSTADDSDDSPGDGNCDDGSGNCTLRAAIEEANNLAGADTINFNISGAGVHTITPASDMMITDQVTIDGETQTDAQCGTLVPTTLPASNTPHTLRIEIDPSDSLTQGIHINGADATGSIIRGLVINNAVAGVFANNVESVEIECNYIGTNATGTATDENSAASITIGSDATNIVIENNLISGSNNSDGISVSGTGVTIRRNLIGTNASGTAVLGNDDNGVRLVGDGGQIFNNVIVGSGDNGIFAGNTSATILGNYIGLGVDGNALGNTDNGILFFSTNNSEIGGVDTDERNTIAANGGDGIYIHTDCGSTSSNIGIYNNYIGTNVSGAVEEGFGNGESGIEIYENGQSCGSIYRYLIGGVESGQPNIIAGNEEQGILIHQSLGADVFSISIIKNSIFNNGILGIDLAADNDSDDVADEDIGPNTNSSNPVTYPTTTANNYLNHPVVNSAQYDTDSITVNYDFLAQIIESSNDNVSLLAKDLVGYRLDFYLNDSHTDGNYNGYAQAQVHLGSFIVDGSEDNANHEFVRPQSFQPGQYVTATATLLWTRSPTDALEPRDCTGQSARTGTGPPYNYTDACPT